MFLFISFFFGKQFSVSKLAKGVFIKLLEVGCFSQILVWLGCF